MSFKHGQNPSNKKFNVFKGFRIGLCTKVKKTLNYESLPYENEKKKDEVLITSRPSSPQLLVLPEEIPKLDEKIHFQPRPKFHSTKIEQSTFTDNFSTIKAKIASSTKIEDNSLSELSNDLNYIEAISEKVNNAYDNLAYSSPCVTVEKKARNNDENQFTSYYSIRDFNLVNSTHFEAENIFVCCLSYRGKFRGDLNLEFSEKVRVKHETDKFALVEKISTGQTGYVPRSYITSLEDFEKNNN